MGLLAPVGPVDGFLPPDDELGLPWELFDDEDDGLEDDEPEGFFFFCSVSFVASRDPP